MEREYTIIIEKDDYGYYIGSVAGLPGCHTQAKSIDELIKRMKEAIELYLEVEKDLPTTEVLGIQKIVL
jgi:predicted RNase H-like HicB family nuclease